MSAPASPRLPRTRALRQWWLEWQALYPSQRPVTRAEGRAQLVAIRCRTSAPCGLPFTVSITLAW